jgi:hypothetical protein
MKKLLVYSLLVLCVFLTVYGEWRSFYCLENGKCVTVWKTFYKACYIIPGKYYGLLRPSDNYLKCATYNNLSLYFSDDIPNSIVYKSFGNIDVQNVDLEEVIFYDYESNEVKFDSIFYIPGAKNYDDVKANAQFIDIRVLENVATGKNGRIN